MKILTIHDVPGLRDAMRAAWERQENVRLETYLDFRRDVAGFPVVQFTLRHWIRLELMGNPFVAGGKKTTAAALSLLWQLSPKFIKGNSPLARWRRFRHRLYYERLCLLLLRRKHLHLDLVALVDKWVDDQFLDAPGGPHRESPSPDKKQLLRTTSFVADLMDDIAGDYHWRMGEILDLPLPQLWQARNAILERRIQDFRNGQLTDVIYREGQRQLAQMKEAQTRN